MQDRYAGDIGDFGKLCLLRALNGEGLRLGVVWYLNPVEEGNSDGNRTQYPHLRSCAPDLYDRLAEILKARSRSVAAIEAAKVLPSESITYSSKLPVPRDPSRWIVAREARKQWAAGALQAISDANLIFLDPDNGLANDRLTKSTKRSLKYAFCDEVDEFRKDGRSVILYQHLPRKPLKEFIAGMFRRLSKFGTVWALSFHPQSVRIYFIISADRHQSLLRERSLLFVKGTWGNGGWCRLHGL